MEYTVLTRTTPARISPATATFKPPAARPPPSVGIRAQHLPRAWRASQHHTAPFLPLSPSSSRDCDYGHDACGDCTRQGLYGALQTAASPPSLAPLPRRRRKPTSTSGGTPRRRAILENLVGQLTRKFAKKTDAERAIEKVGCRGFRWAAVLGEDLIQAGARAQVRAQAQAHVQPAPPVPAPAILTPTRIRMQTPSGAPRLCSFFYPRPVGERESVRAAVEARIRAVRLRAVVVGGSYGGANESSCPKAYRNAFHLSPSKGTSSAMYMCIPARTTRTAALAPHFTHEARKMRRGEVVAPFGYMRGAWEVPASEGRYWHLHQLILAVFV
ncbi:hypothetical protein MSAN_02378500 [Mycena sanguinolenta]|uniref:Uncharacterized protein n=1 Tax=Mycena sanguinolenta TaxID=230812 RepID=A0A8H6X5E0_9AGAR|nr:hypothetical protein MSAN_02378500 [Mycena sanguinolenta]